MQHLPATALRSVVEQLLSLPVAVSYDLRQVSGALFAAGLIADAYAPAAPFERPFSSLLALDVSRNLREARRGAPDQDAIRSDVLARLSATQAIADWLRAEHRRRIETGGQPMLRLNKQPFRLQATFNPLDAGDLDVLRAFELLENRAGLLDTMIRLAQPSRVRRDVGRAIGPMRLLNVSERQRFAYLLFAVPREAEEADLAAGAFGLILSDGEPDFVLEPRSWPSLACNLLDSRPGGFTRGPKDKKNTAIFIGGGNMAAGQALLGAVRAKFFGKFRVSVMFDCNGSNTTAAAAVAWLAHGRSLRGKRAVVLAGTGPVGQRAAALLSSEGATVAITGRKLDAVQAATASIKSRFGFEVAAIAAATNEERGAAVSGANVVLATGAAGITLLQASEWQESPTLELVADANASPPAGIEGVAMADRGTESHGKILFGALGFGALKLALHRACIARLFDQNDLLLDAEEIYALAKTMVVGKAAA